MSNNKDVAIVLLAIAQQADVVRQIMGIAEMLIDRLANIEAVLVQRGLMEQDE